MVIKVWNNIFT